MELLFYSLFKDLVGKGVVLSIELKNGVIIQGKLAHVDTKLNFSLYDLKVDLTKYPQFATMKNCLIRGSTIRYVHMSPSDMDPEIVQEAYHRTGGSA